LANPYVDIEPPSYYILTKEQLKQNLFPTIETIDGIIVIKKVFNLLQRKRESIG
jgi:hypothetical protein